MAQANRTEQAIQADAPIPSRRQRFLGLARATRDTYIPRLTGSVTSLASGVSSRAFGGSNQSDLYDELGNLVFPKDTTITMFPSYTRHTDNYYIDVKGWLSCPGLMTRKNRLILSLARQITRYNTSSQTTSQAMNQLESESLSQDTFEGDSSDTESIVSDIRPGSISSTSSQGSMSNEETLRERLACFIARSIPYAQLTVLVGSANPNDESVTRTVQTDQNGHFDLCIQTSYVPTIVQVKAATNETIFAFQDINLVSTSGLGLISDIDDTVKLTGIVGDKRELMQNLLLKDISSWTIPPVTQWYQLMLQNNPSLSFHYVSNSPWQLFTTIDQYLKSVSLPINSVHLKQYTGNILSSLMEPSSSRKRTVLTKIIRDFPGKRFVCVGDSGEHDFEAYVDLAFSSTSQVAAIYIRYVPDSLSDIDDSKILKEIGRILSIKRRKLVVSEVPLLPEMAAPQARVGYSEPSTPQAKVVLPELVSPLIPELVSGLKSSAPKLAPMVPKKPSSLRGSPVRKPPPEEIAPPLPARSHERAQSPAINSPGASLVHESMQQPNERPGMPSINRESRSQSPSTSLQNIFSTQSFFELEEMDKKGATWIRRVVQAAELLEDKNVEIRFFVDDDDEFFEHAAEFVKNLGP